MIAIGGSLKTHPIFNKILSVGFEFESDSLIKMTNLINNSKTNYLINSDLSIRTLEQKKEENTAKINDNYVEVIYDIPNDKKFTEYFFENSKNKNIKFQITNDFSDDEFADLIRTKCEKIPIDKNDLFYIKTTDKKYKITFTTNTDICEQFSNVEYVATYYKPKISSNIIIDYFKDTCKKIIDHLSDLEQENGRLLIANSPNDVLKKKTTEFTTLIPVLSLFHKKNTNLFYMSKSKLNTIDEIVFIPQMTFKCNAIDTLDVMKQIVLNETQIKNPKNVFYDEMTYLYDFIIVIEEISEKVLQNAGINITDNIGKKIKLYLFLILYKLFVFINHNEEFQNSTYLKDRLQFASRHHNLELYECMKDLIEEHYEKIHILDLFSQKILKELYLNSPPSTALIGLRLKDPNFGDPRFSMLSYFEYFEENQSDWLVVNNYDIYSTTFPLKNDEVLIENRSFFKEIMLYLYDNGIIKDENKSELSLNEMKLFVLADKTKTSKEKCKPSYELIHNKCREKCKYNKVRNLITGRCITQKKCKPSQEMIDNKCREKCKYNKVRNIITGRCKTEKKHKKN